jgi:RNA polymerase sigma-70 factor (ECF subfamily)
MLYDTFGAGLFRLAYRLTGTREDAEDVVHDVFVGLPEALTRYEERGRLGAWLRRVTARVALMRVRGQARRRETRLEDTAAIPARADGTEQVELWAVVNTLPTALRSVLVLKEMEGYSHAEIADLLGISVVTSRVRLLRAMRRLRRTLEEDRR